MGFTVCHLPSHRTRKLVVREQPDTYVATHVKCTNSHASSWLSCWRVLFDYVWTERLGRWFGNEYEAVEPLGAVRLNTVRCSCKDVSSQVSMAQPMHSFCRSVKVRSSCKLEVAKCLSNFLFTSSCDGRG